MTHFIYCAKSARLVLIVFSAIVVLTACLHSEDLSDLNDRESIIATNANIRAGFASQDIQKILSFHHPGIEKVLSWDDYQSGHEQMRMGLASMFENYHIEFQGNVNDMESLEIFTDTAVMIADFSILGRPKSSSHSPFTFSGRTMIVYVRDMSSQTGWVMMREMIVPEDR